jgi:hypothetical protein
MGIEGAAPCILNFAGDKWSVTSCTTGCITCRKGNWTKWRGCWVGLRVSLDAFERQKPFDTAGSKTQHLGHPASSLINVPTGVSQILDGWKCVQNPSQTVSSLVSNPLLTEVNKTHYCAPYILGLKIIMPYLVGKDVKTKTVTKNHTFHKH